MLYSPAKKGEFYDPMERIMELDDVFSTGFHPNPNIFMVLSYSDSHADSD